jgi:hypothetical protein
VISWFQNLLCKSNYKICFFTFDLYRYTEASRKRPRHLTNRASVNVPHQVGLSTLNPLDPYLESAWLQPLSL